MTPASERGRFGSFGDEVVVEFAFGVDAALAVFGTGAAAGGHCEAALGVLPLDGSPWRLWCGGAQGREQHGAAGVGRVGLSGGCGPDDGAVAVLDIEPAAERFR